MRRIAFTDGEKFGIYDGGVTRFESENIQRYREYAQMRRQNDAWKMTGDGARFRGDSEIYNRVEKISAYINGVSWDNGKIVYCYTVGESSGVYRKDIENERAREEHIYTANDREVLSVHCEGERIAVTVRSDDVTSQVGVLHARTSELVTLTDGDARDANAHFESGEIYFDSAGVGRNSEGEFSGMYSPSAVMAMHPDSLAIREIAANDKYSYIKPKRGADGALWCIRRPVKEKKGGNIFFDIILFPYRIIKAIFGFLQMFTVLFAGESLTSRGDNPAKGRKADAKKLFVDGNLIAAEQEYKRNKKFKDREYGFIPASWKLVKITAEGEEVLFGGVCDFALAGDDVYYTDGRHVAVYRDGKHKKLVDCEMCLSIAVEPEGSEYNPTEKTETQKTYVNDGFFD